MMPTSIWEQGYLQSDVERAARLVYCHCPERHGTSLLLMQGNETAFSGLLDNRSFVSDRGERLTEPPAPDITSRVYLKPSGYVPLRSFIGMDAAPAYTISVILSQSAASSNGIAPVGIPRGR